MKPAQLIHCFLVLGTLTTAGSAWAQAPGNPDAEPAAAAPAPPPAPLAPSGPGDLPPPPPPKGAPPPPPQGHLVISAPPVPPPVQRAGYHVHDGFYLRLAAGVGGGHASVRSDTAAASDFSIGGPGLALNLWLGGTPWRGLALGGMVGLQGMGDSNVVVNGNETHEDMSGGLFYVGPFIDAFPDPMRGLHVGGSLGLVGFAAKGSGNALANRYNARDYNAGGLGASAWVGYMGWVGPEFSLGGMLHLTVFGTGNDKQDEIDRKAGGYALNLSFTALYH